MCACRCKCESALLELVTCKMQVPRGLIGEMDRRNIWHGARFLGFVCWGASGWERGDVLPRGILSSLIGHGLACTRRVLSLVMHKG